MLILPSFPEFIMRTIFEQIQNTKIYRENQDRVPRPSIFELRGLIEKEASFIKDDAAAPARDRERFVNIAALAMTYTSPDEIRVERQNQDRQWGGPEHDDRHTFFDFKELIDRQASFIQKSRGDSAGNLQRLVKIAALAVAVIESIDRKTLVAV